ncbi:4Fe-4S dicluster domain-containing protein [Clostridium sartagoforme]|uniref:Ferredoxin n=1 Tax=Clostridium sartagoforme TaxID=84031 RepID=A0A4V3RLK4_9CLOT|nr:EFR1 family ferrodoxin [Clostridium sartagoforme]TGY44060.1 4Fe-4S dicluster domain-containing protein [Clostridium sartagoforme]
MILYFSGTGNSSYTAKTIQSVIGDEIVSINELMKKESKETLKSNKPFVFVCPTYAWRIPRVVEAFIKETKFLGEKDVYFIMTCGGDTGNAINYIKDLCVQKGFNLKGFASLKMPDNYITMYNTPKREDVNEMIEASTKIVTSLSEDIKVGNSFKEKEINLGDKLKSGIVNSLFYSAFVSAKGFKYTEECISCGKCVKLCPLNNIELVKGKPKWGEKCTHCMACISRCPKEAIEYKNKTKGRNRYYLEN